MRIASVFLSCCVLAGCSTPGRSVPQTIAANYARSTSAVRSTDRYQQIFSFRGSNGQYPLAGLISVKNTLYGTTSYGGASYGGVVYKITTTGDERVLHSFGCGSDGATPHAPPTNVNGVLYGTASGCGKPGHGVVYRVTTSGSERVLYSFKGGPDGAFPIAPLLDVDGTLYGTTYRGGADSVGTVYKIATGGTEKVIYAFKGGSKDGANPEAGLTNVKGVLYGTSSVGGPDNHGAVYKVTTDGAETVLHFFTGRDGAFPSSSLLYANGTLYGTTFSGGAHGYGTVIESPQPATKKLSTVLRHPPMLGIRTTRG